MGFQGDHIRLQANASCFSCPAPSSLGGQGDMENKTKFLQGMISLKRQAQKFLGRLFTKSRELRRFLKAAVRGGLLSVRIKESRRNAPAEK
jgi:hypothetical protein